MTVLALPTWADTPEARALILAIVEERPDASNPRDPSWGHRSLTYHGHYAPKLRRYFSNLLDAAIARSTAEFIALNSQEHPDALIERLLADETAVQELADGWSRWAA